jgi:dTDP-4-amino-4,6-dideoxygalactose transaminase
MFYMICNSLQQRSSLIEHLKKSDILAVFHYLSLHKSIFYQNSYLGENLINSDRYTDCLVRLPLFHELSDSDLEKIINSIMKFNMDE